MNSRIKSKRLDGIERARELVAISKDRKLSEEEIEELKISHTGDGGISEDESTQCFTPDIVANFMTSLIPIHDNSKILEPSCGTGVFLNSLYKKNPNIHVTGIEISMELSQIASICYPEADIICGNALKYMGQFENSMDIVIGNPPFGKFNEQMDGFKYAKQKYEEYFLEMAVRCLKEGGEAILILPEGILANDSSKNIRNYLLGECYYRGTISLPPETFYFSGTSCGTSIAYFKKKYKGCKPEDYPIYMAECENIGWNSRGTKTGKCELDEIREAYLKEVEPKQVKLFVPGKVSV